MKRSPKISIVVHVDPGCIPHDLSSSLVEVEVEVEVEMNESYLGCNSCSTVL
jgi:hypothetical protein